MKLTEQRLKQIILEEIATMNEEDKIQSDVQLMAKQISRINTPVEYYQILLILLNHELNPTHKKAALLKLKPLFMKLLQSAGAQETPEENNEQ
mgnify:CR=1 FL=1